MNLFERRYIMEQRIKISPLDTAILTCPDCGRSKILQLSEYKLEKRFTKLKYTCRCNRTCMVTLENRLDRNSHRCFAGTYTAPGVRQCTGPMVVKRLDSKGLTLKTNRDQNILPGITLEVEFVLDDAKQSMVKKDVRVTARQGNYLTAEFLVANHVDDLGDYLFFNKLYV